MASIYKRGKKWWVHYIVNGQHVQKPLNTKSERVALEVKKKLEAMGFLDQLEEESNINFDSFLQDFCEHLRSTRPKKSATNDLSNLRSIFGPCCPALVTKHRTSKKFKKENTDAPMICVGNSTIITIKKLEQLSSEMINNHLRNRMQIDKISPKTVNRNREALSAMFNFAIEHYGYRCPDSRYKHPIEGVKRQKDRAPEITWLTKELIKEQLENLKYHHRMKAIVAVYIYAGLRREEALWLTPADVDLKTRMIKVRAKTIGQESWQPKTKINRAVPISKALYEILSEYEFPKSSLWYFPTTNGGRWDCDNFSRDLRIINRAAGLTWSCLDYRHTFGSQLAQNNISLYKISKLMGNSPEICRRHYAALVPELMQEVVEFDRESSTPSNNEPVDSNQMNEVLQEMLEIKKMLNQQNGNTKRVRSVKYPL